MTTKTITDQVNEIVELDVFGAENATLYVEATTPEMVEYVKELRKKVKKEVRNMLKTSK